MRKNADAALRIRMIGSRSTQQTAMTDEREEKEAARGIGRRSEETEKR